MRFTQISSVVTLFALGQAFIVPKGTTDGVYAVSTRDGIEYHTKIADASAPSEPVDTSDITHDVASGALDKRQSAYTYCGCTFNMDPGNTDAAVADLKNQLGTDWFGKQINAGQSYYSIRGDVVAFVCMSKNGDNLSTNENAAGFEISRSRISTACGQYIAGAILSDNTYNAVSGYARYKAGDDFCTAARTSKQSTCPK